MDTDTLVDDRIDSGWRLIDVLERAGSSVRAAAWVKSVEDERWTLYIVSKDVDAKGPIASYRALSDALRQVGDPRLSVSDVKLIGEGQRSARDLLGVQPRYPDSVPQRNRLTSVGGMPVEDIYVYPPARSKQTGPKQSILRFVLRTTENPIAVMQRFQSQGKPVLNRSEWRGKEPRSCGVVSVKGRPHAAGSPEPMVFDIEVAYRPRGCITYTGGTKYDGWTALVLDRAQDGTLLDCRGNPLPEGHPPVYRRVDVFDDVEFNEIEFGEFIGEFEVEGVKHVSFEHVMGQIRQSPRVNASLSTSFVAPRRHRPMVKIVLSNSPTGTGVDGFGTRIVNLNKSTPQLQQVVLDNVRDVVTGFIEGQYSVKNMSTDEFVFAELDDMLVDCTPNEEGKGSRFNCLREYLPDSYLDELAMRLMATYEVDVSVVDGPRIGLLLKRAERPRRE